ncbi:MAG: hypothetical protein H6R18_2766 [Proteobacteria bacterium]|nr:hypothetical protein [Pseudomonadota bacterium]
MPPTKKLTTLQITISIALVVLAIVLLGLLFLKSRQPAPSAQELDATLVEEYIRAVAAGDYATAYKKHLDSQYRGQISQADFEKAQKARRAEMGTIQKRELTFDQTSYNLFSPVRQQQLRYMLHYPGKQWSGVVVVSDADGEWRIEGTYFSSANDSLTFNIW